MTDYDDRREAAIQRLNEKRDFRTHLVTYLVVNAMLVGLWAVTGSGFFWPIFPILGWGVGIAIHGYTVFLVRPFTEDDVNRLLEGPAPGAEPPDMTIVITHSLWQRRYGGDRDILGKAIQVGVRSTRVIGVLSPGFELLLPEAARVSSERSCRKPG